MKIPVIYFFLFFSMAAFAQEVSKETRIKKADSLTLNLINPLIKKLYSHKTDEEKEKANTGLLSAFREVLEIPGIFDYNFDSVPKNDVGILRSPDNKFRIIHWDIVKNDGTFEYYGFIQAKHYDIKKKGFHKTKTEIIQLYPLIDKSSEIKNPDNAITDNKKWYGMLYYKIIPSSTKSKDYYTLLGWDGNDKFSQKKIIDVLSFDRSGIPVFGADLFNYQKRFPKRVIFEYSATCTMSLKYSTKKDSIIFGHLAPIEPKFEGQYQYYCNDMSFDGFGFKKGKWNYGADVKAVNDREEKDQQYRDPHDKSITNNQSENFHDRMKDEGKKIKKKKKKE